MSKKILIAEDDPVALNLYKLLLNKRPCQLFCFSDGETAKAHAATIQPDFALLDYEMPGADAVELVPYLRSLSGMKNLPIIIVTGHSTTLDKNPLEQLNVTHIFSKPFSPTLLLRAIDEILF